MSKTYWNTAMIFLDLFAKNSLWYLDTDATTANTNIGYEARRLLTKAARDDALNVGRDVNVLIPLNRWSFLKS